MMTYQSTVCAEHGTACGELAATLEVSNLDLSLHLSSLCAASIPQCVVAVVTVCGLHTGVCISIVSLGTEVRMDSVHVDIQSCVLRAYHGL